MLHVTDARTGQTGPVQVRRRRVLRLRVHAERGRGDIATQSRALLISDVMARFADLHALRVLCVVTVPEPCEHHAVVLKASAARLNIHPPGVFTTARDAEAHEDGPADLHIADYVPDLGVASGTDHETPWLQVSPVQLADAFGETPRAEPLSTRMALLSTPYQNPATLTSQTLSRASADIFSWRQRVATWATHPSKPPHRDTVRRCEDALEDNLDTAGALAALRALESDPVVPEGSKFETFVYLDRILGLDLARDIGRPRG